MNDFQPMETAPKDGTPFQARIPGNGSDNIIAWTEGLLDVHGNECGAWAFLEDQDAPECWIDGICWADAGEGVVSIQPDGWKKLPMDTANIPVLRDPGNISRAVIIDYTNHRGERAKRHIIPLDIRFESSQWHPDHQWLLHAVDLDKKTTRAFAMKDIHGWSPAE